MELACAPVFLLQQGLLPENENTPKEVFDSTQFVT
jgi:hypothetical protein